MPRKEPLPEHERQIAERFLEMRRLSGQMREHVANQIGVEPESLKRVEMLRTQLRYGLADLVLRHLNCSAAWLAEGKLPMKHYFEPSPAIARNRPENMLFSAVYQAHLRVPIHAQIKEASDLFGIPEDRIQPAFLTFLKAAGATERERIARSLMRRHLVDLAKLPESLWDEYLTVTYDALNQYCDAHKSEIESKRPRPLKLRRPSDTQNISIPPLTDDFSNAKTSDMAVTHGSLWKQLQSRVRRAVEMPGAKLALAKKFGVTPGAVSQWLNSDKEKGTMPTAETTLRLLQWVEAEEAKQKSPGSA